ncbi:MAG: hypothetical protein ACKOW3_03765 [Hyphomicrobium sp.]
MRVTYDLIMAQHQIKPIILSESDDMSMLRLLAGSRPRLTLVPSVVVRQELNAGTLVERCRIPDIQERFYVSMPSHANVAFLIHLLMNCLDQRKWPLSCLANDPLNHNKISQSTFSLLINFELKCI